jgi:hypothetical protein
MRELAYYEAKLEALREIMAADDRVRLIHETFLGLSPRQSLFGEIEKTFPAGSFLHRSRNSALRPRHRGGDGRTPPYRRSGHRQFYI